jgi:hypothetical protein
LLPPQATAATHRPARPLPIHLRFEQYDQGLDGFELLHDGLFDPLVLLTGVQLQKGNPQRQTRTGDAQNLTVDFTHTYDGDRPRTKSGELTYTNGANATTCEGVVN